MRRRPPVTSSLLPLVALLWLAAPLATASPQPSSPPPGQEVRADAFSVAELAADARGVKVGGGLIVSGLQIEADSPSAVLDLQRFRVFTDDARVVVHGEAGEEVLRAPDNAYFRGRVDGDPDSLALLSVLPSGRVRGLVQRDGRLYVLRPARPVSAPSSAQGAVGTGGPGGSTAATDAASGPVPLEAVAAASLDEGKEGFTCANADLSLPPLADLTSGAAGNEAGPFEADFAGTGTEAMVTPHTARVAIETDWEYFQIFGNTTAATDYIGDLIAYSSTIYDAEVDTDLQISYLSLWSTSADPWGQSSTICGLYEFGQYWNANRTGVERTLAHFLSGRNNGGGVAWVGVLCQGAFQVNIGTSCTGLGPAIDNYGGDYGYTGAIDGDFDPDNPAPLWDIVAVSHEIGHNFNSPHTHCYEGIGGSSSAVDECYGTQGGSACYSGPTSYPSGCPFGVGTGCGTIMSYCHSLPGGLSNIALTFGEGHPYGTLPQRVPDRMRAHVESRANLAPACLARVGTCTENLDLTSGTDNGTESYSVCGTITAGGSYKVGSSGDVTMTAGTVVLTDGFQVESGGTLRIGDV